MPTTLEPEPKTETDTAVAPARKATPSPLDEPTGTPSRGRQGVRMSIVITGLVLIASGAYGLSGDTYYPPTFEPNAMAANFLYDIRSLLAVISGLMILNLCSMIKA